MTGLIVPAATAAATTATLWFIPILVAAVSFYQYDKTDPEGRPKDTKVRVEVREREGKPDQIETSNRVVSLFQPGSLFIVNGEKPSNKQKIKTRKKDRR